MLLTDAGHRLYGFAQRILGSAPRGIEAVSGRGAPLTGELSLAASSIPGEHLLPDL